MKPTEYWVCALVAGEPECWDGPHRTAAKAREARRKDFDSPKFDVYEVKCRRVPAKARGRK